MMRLKFLTVLFSIKAVLESNNKDKALEFVNEVIAEVNGRETRQNYKVISNL